MKKVFTYLCSFAIVLFFSTKVFSQATYTWSNAAGGAWTTATNWTPTRTTPATTDILIFNTAPTGNVTMSASSQTIGKLQITSTNFINFFDNFRFYALVSGVKAVITNLGPPIISRLRIMCGGHGYFSGILTLFNFNFNERLALVLFLQMQMYLRQLV